MATSRGLPMFSPMVLQEGLATLSRGDVFRQGSLDAVLSSLAEQAASLSGLERAGIWAFNHDQTELRCLELYLRSTRRHNAGEVLHAERYPAYFEALKRDGVVVADDAYVHPATQGFAEAYLLRHGITAILDTAIYVRGELQGVFSLEQVGMRQPWNSVHRIFAQSMANLVTMALVEFEAAEAKKEAGVASERLRVVFEASPDALLLTEEPGGIIIDANHVAERLFGYRRVELVGKLRSLLHPPEICAGGRLAPIEPITLVRCHDGHLLPVEMSYETVQLEDGRSLALGIYRTGVQAFA